MREYLEFNGYISGISYSPQLKDETKFKVYKFDDFNSNECSAFGIIKIDENNTIYFTKWVTPKRTRSYPFERLYNVFDTNSKIITIIPIIKDEGGDSGNNDRINAITYSWMNLLNIYIILAFYETAEKLDPKKRKTAANLRKEKKKQKTEYITNQKFNKEYIKEKIDQIANFKTSALHWNTKHFREDFEIIWKRSVECYKKISKNQNVRMHSFENHLKRLDEFKVNNKFDIEKFKEVMNKRSREAQHRETQTIHDLESLGEGVNGKFYIKNYLGGIYYLTCDEVFVESGEFVIQESKNTSRGKLPNLSDIKDGLFKLILFSNLEVLKYKDDEVKFKTRLKLTGNLKGELLLPTDSSNITAFVNLNRLKDNVHKRIFELNKEAFTNNIDIHICSNLERNEELTTTTHSH